MAAFPTDKTATKGSSDEKMESKPEDAESLMDMSQALLQLLGNAVPAGGTLLSPLLLAQAASGSLVPAAAAAQMSLPWMLPAQYQQLMVLQQGLAQQLLLPSVSEFHDGQTATANDRTGNQLEATADANPLLAAILQRHSMAQRQLQKVDDSDRNAATSSMSLSPNSSSLLTAAGMPLQNVQFEGLSGQTGSWSVNLNEHTKLGIIQEQQQQQQQQLQQRPRPPKKPLTPYMIFSKEIWHQVKAANSHLSSVTEIGAIVGRLWRDLDPEKKEHYNEMFNKNKVRYDEEIRVYLKKNNLRPSDLTRSRISRRHSSPLSNSMSKLHEPSKQPALGKSQAVFGSSNQDFSAQSVQQLLGQINFTGETVFPSGVAVSDVSGHVGQALSQAVSSKGQEQLLHTSTMAPSVNSLNPGKCASSSEATAWVWHQPMGLVNDAHSQAALGAENGVDQQSTTETLASTGALATQARYYSIDGLDQLLKLKEQNEDKLRELVHINGLQMQILQLESALSERTQKVNELRQELDSANALIAHLKEQQQQQATGIQESVSTEAESS